MNECICKDLIRYVLESHDTVWLYIGDTRIPLYPNQQEKAMFKLCFCIIYYEYSHTHDGKIYFYEKDKK